MDDLLSLLIDKIDYDFCEDDDDVQGTWEISRNGHIITISYEPFDDSPHPQQMMIYRFDRIS